MNSAVMLAVVICLLLAMFAVTNHASRYSWKVGSLLAFLTGWFGQFAVRYVLGY